MGSVLNRKENKEMARQFHGYTSSKLAEEAYRVACQRHRNARIDIADKAFELYGVNILSSLRTLDIPEPDNPESGESWESCLRKKARKISDFVDPERTVKWRDDIQFFVLRAIDGLYGYDYCGQLRQTHLPIKTEASSSLSLIEAAQEDLKESSECEAATLQVISKMSRDSLVEAAKETAEALESKQRKYDAIINALNELDKERVAS